MSEEKEKKATLPRTIGKSIIKSIAIVYKAAPLAIIMFSLVFGPINSVKAAKAEKTPEHKAYVEKMEAAKKVDEDFEALYKYDEPAVAKQKIDEVLVKYFDATPPETLSESVIMLRDAIKNEIDVSKYDEYHSNALLSYTLGPISAIMIGLTSYLEALSDDDMPLDLLEAISDLEDTISDYQEYRLKKKQDKEKEKAIEEPQLEI